MQTNRDFSLDFVRAISILLIIFFHYNCATVRVISKEIMLFGYYGYTSDLGVSMFFILSGASLALSSRFNFSLKRFYQKRFLAIFPLFWTIYIMVVLAVTIILQTNYFVGLNRLTFLLTVIGMDGFLLYKIPNYYLVGEWFLGCIIILYLIFPVLKYLFDKNKYLMLAGSFGVSLLLDRFYRMDMFLLWFPLFRVCELIFGMYFVTVCRGCASRRKYMITLAAIFAVLGVLWILFYDKLYITIILRGMSLFVILSIVSSLFSRRIPRKVVYFLSTYSYAAFLSHHVILTKIVERSQNILMVPAYNWVVFGMTLMIIYLFSFVVTEIANGVMGRLLPQKRRGLEGIEGYPGISVQQNAVAEFSAHSRVPQMR